MLLLPMLLSGCAVKLAYNNLDRLVRWQTADYIDFTKEQREFFDARFDEYWHWHRGTQLPRYSAYLRQLSSEVEAGFDEAAAARLEENVLSWITDGMDASIPLMTELLLSLDADQRAELATAMAEQNMKLLEEEEAFEFVDSVEDNYRRFIGRLTPEQRLVVSDAAQRYQRYGETWIAYRQDWQAELMALLERQPDYDVAVAEMRLLVLERERWYSPEMKELDERNTALFRELGTYVFTTLSDRQRKRAVNRINDYADIFDSLHRSLKPAPDPAPCLIRC
ncbi:MAG: DUF6279 family lipoprotein [Pseudomonadaceae bacterium]|nr:DUF6279 family lipoprotein [Pseudomonadaceae bacterium]